MKALFSILVFSLVAIGAGSQTLDPLSADSVTIVRNQDGTYTIGVHYFFPPADSATTAQFLQNRVKTFQRQASQLAQESDRRQRQAAREARFFEDRTGIPLDSLFASILEGLAGDWVLKIGDKKDNLTIEKDGRFKSKKSGNGQIKIAAEDKILLAFEGQGTTLELYKRKETWRSLDGENVVLERKVDAKK